MLILKKLHFHLWDPWLRRSEYPISIPFGDVRFLFDTRSMGYHIECVFKQGIGVKGFGARKSSCIGAYHSETLTYRN